MSAESSKPINELGLTEIYCPPDPLVDVVFVHGLNGHPYNTWATRKPDVYWPRDLLPQDVDQERCRILTYGYDANVSAFRDGASKDHIHHHGETLAARLAANRSRTRALERPLIFVVHSLGGLVVKRSLIYCFEANHPNQERLRSIFVSTYGIIFLGTPHNGSDLAKWGSLLQSICAVALPKKVFDSQSQLIKALETNNETLQVINREFTQILSKFRIYFFHEAKPMDMKGTRQFVVDEDSAAPNLQGVERAGIERDHSHMCKFEDENAPGYDLVSEAIQRYASEAPTKIPGRWQAEKRNQQLQRQDDVRELLGETLPDITNTTVNTGSAHVSQGTSMENSVASVKLLDQASSQSSNPPPLVAPLGFRPNTIFKGFEEVLEWMDRKFKSEKKALLGTNAILLWGPPGCGKSHLARQYVWTHRNEHPAGTFWLDCKTESSLKESYWEVGRRIGCLNESNSNLSTPDTSFINVVREALKEKHGWIIVLDGILFTNEDEINSFQQYLPDSQGNKIIYTSVDKTLERRHRLLVPSAFKVPKLRPDAACELLFASLNIKSHKATRAQRAKADELVKYYNYLPLGIHAAAHALIARGRALERFSPGPSDNRLAQPFLDIIDTLHEGEYTEAINLLTLLSFINHHIPVALLQFGAKSLSDKGCEIESIDFINGGRRHIDNTIAVLIQRGLIERQLQSLTKTSSNQDSPSPEASRRSTYDEGPYAPDALPVPALIPQYSSDLNHEPVPESHTEIDSLRSLPTGIDTISVHTVVQTIVRDEKKSNNVDYYDWLVLASHFFQASYKRAKNRNQGHISHGSVTDFAVYLTHGMTLLGHFPSTPKAVPRPLWEARHSLRALLSSIEREIENQSPHGSNGSDPFAYRSVFERSASSSEEGPDTPVHNLSRSTTWSTSLIERKAESPTDIQQQNRGTLMDTEDTGYVTDVEDHALRQSNQWSLKSGASTTRGRGDSKASANPSVLETILTGYPAGRRKDLGEFKRVPVVGSVKSETAQRVPSQSLSPSKPSWWKIPFRRSSSTSQAERALTALRDNKRQSSAQAVVEDDSMEPTQSESDIRTEPVRVPFRERPINPQIPYGHMESKIPTLLTKSPNDGVSSTSPRLLPALLTSQAATAWNASLPVEENIVITRRQPNFKQAGPIRIIDNTPVGVPDGYYSSTAMSRDPSRDSQFSVQSLPARTLSIAGSPVPDIYETRVYRTPVVPSLDAALGPMQIARQTEAWAYNNAHGAPSEGVYMADTAGSGSRMEHPILVDAQILAGLGLDGMAMQSTDKATANRT